MTSVFEMDSTDLLRSEGALIKLNMESDLIWRWYYAILWEIASVFLRLSLLTLTTNTSWIVCDALASLQCASSRANTYKSAAHRPNLVVLTEAQAIKIEFDHSAQDVTARGVSFQLKCRSFTAKARKEVVLSAGQLIMAYDTNCQSSVVRVLKVYSMNGSLHENSQKTYDGPLTASSSMLSCIDFYYLASSSKVAHMHRSLSEDVKKEKPKKMGSVEIIPHLGKHTIRRSAKSLAECVTLSGHFELGPAKANTSYISVIMCIQHPFSGVNIYLNTSDPLSPSAIDPNYLSKQIDQSILVESVKFADKIAKAETLAAMLVARQDPSADIKSDEDITKWVKGNIRTLHSPIGTAATVHKSVGGVVDEKLKVYGTNNLQMVDASVIPTHLASHRTVYGVAEKAADIIKSDWGF
ncbi:GMC oxidoreductase, partial [Rhizoctonia solani]